MPRKKSNRLQHAVALVYEQGELPPQFGVGGSGVVVEQIIGLAREKDIFVHNSKDLVALLMRVDLDGRIPIDLYKATAEILTWLYKLEHSK